MPYTPDPTDVAAPADVGILAATAAAEFRAIKNYIQNIRTGVITFTDITVNSALTAWGSGINFLDIGNTGALYNETAGLQLLRNSYNDGTNYRAKTAAAGFRLNMTTTEWSLHTAPSVAAAAIQAFTKILSVDSAGVLSGASLSGQFTPVVTPSVNITSVTAAQTNWMRLGNVVFMTGGGTVTPTAANTASNFTMTLPVATVMPSSFDGSGTFVMRSDDTTDLYIAGRVTGGGTFLTLSFATNADVAGDTVNYSYSCSYEVA